MSISATVSKFSSITIALTKITLIILGAFCPLLSKALHAGTGRPLLFSTLMIRNKESSNWSDAGDWAGGTIPGQGDHVLIDLGHSMSCDLLSPEAIRLVHVCGKLVFSQAQTAS